MSENQCGHVALVLLVNLDRNALSIIHHRDGIAIGVHHHFHPIHGGITLLVIGSIDNDFIKNLVESRSVRDVTTLNALRLGVENKHWLGDLLRAPNVRIGTKEDVFELSLLLVGLFDCLVLFGRFVVARRCFGCCSLGGGVVGAASSLLRRRIWMSVFVNVLIVGVARGRGGVGAADALGVAVEIHCSGEVRKEVGGE